MDGSIAFCPISSLVCLMHLSHVPNSRSHFAIMSMFCRVALHLMVTICYEVLWSSDFILIFL